MNSWLEEAKRLPFGHKLRLNHDCGEGRDMIVSHNEAGYSAYCFRCGPVGFHAHGVRTLAELEELKALNEQAKENHDVRLTGTVPIPEEFMGWLLVAGITPARAAACGFCWHPKMHRIVMPLRGEDGTWLYWQARAVRVGQRPKYINPTVDKETLGFLALPEDYPVAGTHCDTSAIHGRVDGRSVVVTEDILSAVRVGRSMPAVSCLGTKASGSQIGALSGAEKVFIWLDPDQAGLDGATTMKRQLSLVVPTEIVDSRADPKLLSDEQIRDHLNLPRNKNLGYNFFGEPR
jgi:DNA primase